MRKAAAVKERKSVSRKRRHNLNGQGELELFTARKQVGDYIRHRREELGLTQADVCKTAKIVSPAMSGFENGKRNITPKMRKRLAKALQLPFEAFDKTCNELLNGHAKPAQDLPVDEYQFDFKFERNVSPQPGTIEISMTDKQMVGTKITVSKSAEDTTNAQLISRAQQLVASVGHNILEPAPA